MAKIKPNISSILSRQIPEFIRDEYPSFVTFVQKYYEYIDENYNGRNLKDYRDLDDTLDSFVQYFRNELNVIVDTDFPNYGNINSKEYLLRKAKQYYSAKGSDAAYKFLFRALYGKELEIFYPSTVMLRASDGRWQEDISLFITVTSGSIDDIVAKEIIVYDSSGVRVDKTFVDRYDVIDESAGIYEIFVQRFYGVISAGNIVKYSTTFQATVRSTIKSFEILNGGANFKIGQIYDIDSGAITGAKLKVVEVSSSGAITKARVISFSSGYSGNFIVNLSPLTEGEFDDPSPLTLDLNGTPQFTSPSNSYTAGFSESGTILNSNYYVDAYGVPFMVGTILAEFGDATTYESNTENLASIQFTIGGYAKYPGYFSTNDGFISDAIFIQDSFFYQAYSYELRIDELLNDYINLVKSYIHPAGIALFGNYKIGNTFNIGTTIGPANIQTRLYLSDTFSVSDSTPAFHYYITKTDSITSTDATPLFTYYRNLSDSVTITEDAAKDISFSSSDSISLTDLDFELTPVYGLVDSFSVTESINNIDSDKLFTETLTPSEALLYSLDTAASESITPSESGSAYLNPYSEGSYFAEDYSQNDSSAAATF